MPKSIEQETNTTANRAAAHPSNTKRVRLDDLAVAPACAEHSVHTKAVLPTGLPQIRQSPLRSLVGLSFWLVVSAIAGDSLRRCGAGEDGQVPDTPPLSGSHSTWPAYAGAGFCACSCRVEVPGLSGIVAVCVRLAKLHHAEGCDCHVWHCGIGDGAGRAMAGKVGSPPGRAGGGVR